MSAILPKPEKGISIHMGMKYVYLFGTKDTEGDAAMRNLLGGKGANLAEMARL